MPLAGSSEMMGCVVTESNSVQTSRSRPRLHGEGGIAIDLPKIQALWVFRLSGNELRPVQMNESLERAPHP
jgi:hypothetical protein